MKRSLLALTLVLAGALPAQAADGPTDVVRRLYQAYLDARPEGLPTPAQMKVFAPLLSQRLVRLVEEARQHQSNYAKHNPGDKPPFVEGCLFASLFEGPTAFEIDRMEPQADGRQVVLVSFSYSDPQRPQPPFRWSDAVFVRLEKGRPVVDDVEFRGEWAFKPGGRLSQLLAARD